MRSITTAILVTLLGAIPLGAQLTPAQRQEREAKEALNGGSRRFAEQFERGTAEGDPRWNYAGVVGYRSQFGYGCGGWTCGGIPYVAGSRPEFGTHWVAFTRSGVRPARVGKASTRQFAGVASQPGRVTIASPVGAPGVPLSIRVAIVANDGTSAWDQTIEARGDEGGRYTLLTPPLPHGTYSMKIDVYEPGTSVTPYSSSSDSLTVE